MLGSYFVTFTFVSRLFNGHRPKFDALVELCTQPSSGMSLQIKPSGVPHRFDLRDTSTRKISNAIESCAHTSVTGVGVFVCGTVFDDSSSRRQWLDAGSITIYVRGVHDGGGHVKTAQSATAPHHGASSVRLGS